MNGKREEIVAAAAKLMRSKGYEATRLDDILKAANIGKGQFYYYFSSKHELGLSVIDYSFREWNRALLGGILDSGKDPNERLGEMLSWVIRRHSTDEAKCGCVFGNLAAEMSEHDEKFRQKVQDVFTAWANKIETLLLELAKEGAPSAKEDAKTLSETIVAMLEGGILLMKNKQDIKVLTSMAELVKTVVSDFEKKHKTRE